MKEVHYSRNMDTSAVSIGKEGEKVLFEVRYKTPWGYDTAYESHEIKLYEWAKHLHGNAHSGTPYGYFCASRNGRRVIITV